MVHRHPILPVLLLALGWGLGPALPALLAGALLGHPGTDLYPSVWALWAGAQGDALLPSSTTLLGYPQGMGLALASPLKALAGRALIPVLGLAGTWNALLLAARVATVLAAWAAGRAWGLSPRGALVAAAVWGCSPFFHGYAVEGIAEGTDGWTLALWAWALGRGRNLLAAPLLALTLLSSWYLGAAALLLLALVAPARPRALLSLAGLPLAWPALGAFLSAFPGVGPLDDAVRASMGAPLLPRAPGLLPGLQPFALCAWVGVVVPALALLGRQRLALLALLPALLSLGIGPWYELPGLELLRFPYRLHAATLAILALAAGRAAERWRAPWLAPLIVAEGLLLSPVEPLLPGSPADVPTIYERVDAPLVEVPGPVAMPPGQHNPSRPRARYLLYHQTTHHQPSPWTPDFNGVGVADGDAWLDALLPWDPLRPGAPPADLDPTLVPALRSAGVPLVMVQRAELGPARAAALVAALQAQGATVVATDPARTLLRL